MQKGEKLKNSFAFDKKLSRRKAISTAGKVAVAAIVSGTIAGICGYYAGSQAQAIPTRVVEKTVEKTTTIPGAISTVTRTVTSTVTASPTIVTPEAEWKPWAEEIKRKYGGTKIVCAMAATVATEALEKMIKEFTSITGIEPIFDTVADVYLEEKILTAPDKYDVLMVDFFWIPTFVAKGIVVDLKPWLEDPMRTPEWFDYEDIHPAYRDSCKFGDFIASIPIAGESRIITYRRDLMEKYGQEYPRNLEELHELASFFHKREPELYGWVQRQNPPLALSGFMEHALYEIGDGFWDPRTYKILISTPDSIKALEYYVSMCDLGPPGHEAMGWEESASTFMAGHAALGSHTTAVAPWIEDPEKSRVAGKVEYRPPPPGPKGWFCAVAGWSLALSAKAPEDKRAASWAFITWMTSKLKSKEYILKGGVVTRLSNFEDPELSVRYPYFKGIKECLDGAYNLIRMANAGYKTTWIPQEPLFGDIYGRVTPIIGMAVAHQLSPEEACNEAAKEIERIFKEAGRI
ncbi:MAG: extracellular solute-binding protein [Nitrososphaerota archaeon]